MPPSADLVVRPASSAEIEELIPLLLLAEPSERGLRWGLANLVDTVYRMDDGDRLVGVATMKWRTEPCELMELGVAPELQGQGYGRRLITWLQEEARRRGKQQMLVGTANSSIGNIAFYQKVGFRMDHIRPDYFWYYGEDAFENGIPILDMLVFRYDLDTSDEQDSSRQQGRTRRGRRP